MPRLTNKIPSYRRHKPSGRAVVTLNGKDHYLGPWNSPESKAEYDRLTGEWLAAGRGRPRVSDTPGPNDPTVSETLLAFLNHAETHYRDPDDMPTRELKNVKDALKPVRKVFGKTPARSFGPLALRAVRDAMIRSGLARTTINARINRVRRVFKWAASVELVPAGLVEALRSVDGLREGRTQAHEAEPVGPVPLEHVDAVLPLLSRPVAAMVRLQLLCGCRPGEVRTMRGCDLSAGGPVWEYRPARHKSQWRGKGRVIQLGPKAQEIVREFLKPDLAAYLFAPESRRSARYHPVSYGQAIARGCRKAGVPVWSPLQLRHTAATQIRAQYGLEAAQAVLGHAKADVTQIYAERDVAKARRVASEIG